MELVSLEFPAWAGRFFTTTATWEAHLTETKPPDEREPRKVLTVNKDQLVFPTEKTKRDFNLYITQMHGRKSSLE